MRLLQLFPFCYFVHDLNVGQMFLWLVSMLCVVPSFIFVGTKFAFRVIMIFVGQNYIYLVFFSFYFSSLHNFIRPASQVKFGCDYSIFKKGIRPMWEDRMNQKGGRWIVKFDSRPRDVDIDKIWLDVVSTMLMSDVHIISFIYDGTQYLRTSSHSFYLKESAQKIHADISGSNFTNDFFMFCTFHEYLLHAKNSIHIFGRALLV